MKHGHDIQEELRQIGVRLPESPLNAQTVPEAYFELFYDSLHDRMQSEGHLPDRNHASPYSIPSNYFKQFDQQLMERIGDEEFLTSLPAQAPYHVPAGYFNSLEVQLPGPMDRVSKSTPRSSTFRVYFHKLSIAATLFLFLGLAFKGILLPTGHLPVTDAEARLEYVSDTEISDYVLEHEAELANSLALENADDTHIDLNSVETDVLNHALDAVNDEELLNYPL